MGNARRHCLLAAGGIEKFPNGFTGYGVAEQGCDFAQRTQHKQSFGYLGVGDGQLGRVYGFVVVEKNVYVHGPVVIDAVMRFPHPSERALYALR